MNTELSTPQAAPMSLLLGADLSTVDTDKLEKLLELQAKWEANDARKKFFRALAGFQAEMPPVFKSKQESTGKYRYAAYEDIMRVARPIMQKHGLSVSFSQSETVDALTVECRVSHIEGHSEVMPFTVPKDGPLMTKDGRKITSGAQAQGNANSYARRYCLCNALDIVVSGDDDDCPPAPLETITAAQIAEIEGLLAQIPVTDTKDKMLQWLQVETLADIPADAFRKVLKTLKDKLP
jgi:hypothetical protein